MKSDPDMQERHSSPFSGKGYVPEKNSPFSGGASSSGSTPDSGAAPFLGATADPGPSLDTSGTVVKRQSSATVTLAVLGSFAVIAGMVGVFFVIGHRARMGYTGLIGDLVVNSALVAFGIFMLICVVLIVRRKKHPAHYQGVKTVLCSIAMVGIAAAAFWFGGRGVQAAIADLNEGTVTQDLIYAYGDRKVPYGRNAAYSATTYDLCFQTLPTAEVGAISTTITVTEDEYDQIADKLNLGYGATITYYPHSRVLVSVS